MTYDISGIPNDPFGATMPIADVEKKFMDRSQTVEARMDAPREKLPPAPEIPEFHSAVWSDHAKQVGGILSVAAALLGASSGGAVGAMNSLSAALTGFHNGQMEAGKQHLEEYKAHVDGILKVYKENIDAYKAITNDEHKTMQEMVSEVKILSFGLKDLPMQSRMVWSEIVNLIENRKNAATKIEETKKDRTSREKIAVGHDAAKKKNNSDSPFAAAGVPKALIGVTGEKGKDRFTDEKGKVWDWNYTTKKWEPHKA